MSYLRKFDKKLFEYVNHLNEEGKYAKDLPWDQYSKTSSDWQFPASLEVYYARMWYNQKHILQNKTVLDLGCEIGSKISWFESCGVKDYVGIDTDKNRSDLANDISEIVFGNKCVMHHTPTAIVKHLETHSYDVIYMMSVNQYMSNPWHTINAIQCQYLIMDTWINQGISLSDTLEHLTEKYNLIKLIKLWKDRVGLVLQKI